jgi:hypothetical protein
VSIVAPDAIETLIARCVANASGGWEQDFVASLVAKHAAYGRRMYLSDKQLTIMRRIAGVDMMANSGASEPPADPYVPPRPTLESETVYGALVQLIADNGCTHAKEQLDEILAYASDMGWRFAPDKPTDEMCKAWSNPDSVFPGSRTAMAHCETVYREMMQKCPGLTRGEQHGAEVDQNIEEQDAAPKNEGAGEGGSDCAQGRAR